MPDWRALRHAYGFADDVPVLLAQLSPEQDAPVWNELGSRLLHQGTVYSASYAALPALEAAARRWRAEQRVTVLALAAGIVASRHVVGGSRDQFIRDLGSTIARLSDLTLESLTRLKWSRADFVYLLQAALAFAGDLLWGSRFNDILGGEFPGECPTCSVELYLVIGNDGFFTVAEEWVKRPETVRTPIEPRGDDLPATGRWLRERARAAGDKELASWIARLFGTSRCPRCDAVFTVPEAQERAA